MNCLGPRHWLCATCHLSESEDETLLLLAQVFRDGFLVLSAEEGGSSLEPVFLFLRTVMKHQMAASNPTVSSAEVPISISPARLPALALGKELSLKSDWGWESPSVYTMLCCVLLKCEVSSTWWHTPVLGMLRQEECRPAMEYSGFCTTAGQGTWL